MIWFGLSNFTCRIWSQSNCGSARDRQVLGCKGINELANFGKPPATFSMGLSWWWLDTHTRQPIETTEFMDVGLLTVMLQWPLGNCKKLNTIILKKLKIMFSCLLWPKHSLLCAFLLCIKSYLILKGAYLNVSVLVW